MAWSERLCSPAEALAVLRPGDRVFVGTGCATPLTLLHALETMDYAPHGVQLVHLLLSGALPAPYADGSSRFRHRVFFVGSTERALVRSGRAEYVPVSLAELPALVRTGRQPIDVAMVQVSPPDRDGMCSLGISVDVTRTAVEVANRVVAEVNPSMPRTRGDSLVPFDWLTRAVAVDRPLTEYVHEPVGEVGERIARYVARIVSDGATLHVGLGRVPNEVLRYLGNRRDLGIHSDVITEPLVELVDCGAVCSNRETRDQGRVVGSWAMGTRKLYDLIDDDPRFELRPLEQVCDPAVIAGHDGMVSVTQAFAIDLTGQVCSDEFAGELYGGVAAQPEFHRGAAHARRGKAIVCLASRTEAGEPRVLARLRAEEAVTIPRADVHYVVTEYGMAYLFGRSLTERAVALIELAHPDDRASLLRAAKRLGYVRARQLMRSRSAYPTTEERTVRLSNGDRVLLRPTRTSDAPALQKLFFAMPPRDVYTRFFTNLASLSDDKAQHLCSIDYQHEMAFVAVTGEDWERERVVASSAYYVDPSTELADVALVVHPDWQGLGLGTALLVRTAAYAQAHGVRGFTADVLTENAGMLQLVERLPVRITKQPAGAFVDVVMLFEDVEGVAETGRADQG